ncbi:hypothetical protein V6N12_058577 [Hibiscus sabdariffa]|uniref:Uncharacterized protein n=1 Tax=Hibiscus sabdariffa TaxID=183260 RepID=A0ABR2ESJ3_9ROSI
MWMGAASSDWAGGGDGGGVGVDPIGEAGVDCLLSCVAGVAAGEGAGLVAWSAGGVAAGLGALPAGATSSCCSEAGRVGIAIWMGTASAISIFRMYSLRVQPALSGVYLSAGWVGTAARRQSAEIRNGKARIPLSFWQAADSSLAMTSPTLNSKPVMIALINTSLVWAADGFWVLASNIPDSAWYSPASHGDCIFASSLACVEFQYPIEIGVGWLPRKAEPAKIVEPFIDDQLQAIVGLGIIEEKSLFVSSAFGSNLLVSGRNVVGG